jgi:hypothetical protein
MSGSDFEQFVKETLGYLPEETRVMIRIAENIHSDLRNVIRQTPIADDTDGLLVLSRLSPEKQKELAVRIKGGFDPQQAVELASRGEL